MFNQNKHIDVEVTLFLPAADKLNINMRKWYQALNDA